MELGIFSRTYPAEPVSEENLQGKEAWEEQLAQVCRRMTADGMFHTQFNLSSAGLPTLPESVDEARIVRIGEIVRSYGICMDALSGTFNMIDPDEEARERGCRQFALQCRIAALLQIPLVTLCTGSKNRESKWKWHEDNCKDSSWDDLMRSTWRVLDAAESCNLVLGVETEASNIINTPQRARRYLDETGSSRLKIIMDGANLFRPGQTSEMEQVLTEAFDLLSGDIVLAHAKDFTCEGSLEFVAAGEGMLDFPLYLKLLCQSGYKGPLILHGLAPRQVASSSRFLRSVLQENG